MIRNDASYELVITRIFDAPRDHVYRAFTDPDQLAQWFGPLGWAVPRESVEIDARPGGLERFLMVDTEHAGVTSQVDATFVEVVENELLVGTQAVRPAAGQPGPSGPLTLRVEFHRQGRGKTELAIWQGPYTEEQEGLARQGWEGSFGKLDDLLLASPAG
jgi:uncharacterized protein YndB with AHSA1/START domain